MKEYFSGENPMFFCFFEIVIVSQDFQCFMSRDDLSFVECLSARQSGILDSMLGK